MSVSSDDIILVQLDGASSLPSPWLHVDKPAAPSQGHCNEEDLFPRRPRTGFTIGKRGNGRLELSTHCPSAASTPPEHGLCHMSHTAAPASSTVGLSPRGAQTADSGIIAVEYAFRAHLPWDAVPADCDANGEEGLTGSL
ncbi:hypothetical protein CRENBAI_021839 [Crenichthys baileyi]|uniref:Uncharacterized protein n=1 Tax=Crenichthys baileyi TaxID=28760 RepID=A0AAV9RI71_9TELE